jgi:hypothetical protein
MGFSHRAKTNWIRDQTRAQKSIQPQEGTRAAKKRRALITSRRKIESLLKGSEIADQQFSLALTFCLLRLVRLFLRLSLSQTLIWRLHA